MIERYADHAANERTFLAWVRTAFGLAAFGCVLAKFDLVLRLVTARHAVAGSTSWIGVAAVCVGVALLPVAWWRFRAVRAELVDAKPREIALRGLEGWTTATLVVIGTAVVATLIRMTAA
ncbi:YidH family protein [Nguyenibacter vanlangensis]|uniref:DUF202 domain-containing protein n=1 Tax=Nguyenibacter vanlangensis TaxID=1216886 RepID=A0A7Y7IW37_9PROT|nr:DUF202 domain-containing protein [Nguyenibacter vanlangensis]NVN11158.1 DUF202 domain-containing protein [Nguyenibacter vanlangensis]